MDIDLIDVGAVLVAVAPLTLLVGMFARDSDRIDDLVLPRRELEWPRGVQEEEPVAWVFEHLANRHRQVSTTELVGTADGVRRARPDLGSKPA